MANKMLTYSGGQPLGLNSLDLIQNNVKENIKALSESVNIDNDTAIRLWGVEYTIANPSGTGVYVDVSAGAIYYNGEIYPVDYQRIGLVDGSTIEDFYTDYEFDLNETTDTQVTFADSTTKYIHQYRKAEVTDSPTTWSGVGVKIRSLKDMVYNYSNVNNASTTYINASDLTTLESDPSFSQNAKEYNLEDGQHIVKLNTDANNILYKINAPTNVFDGYEVEVRFQEGSTSSIAIYDKDDNLFSTSGNIKINPKYNYPEIAVYTDSTARNEDITIDTTDYTVSIRSAQFPHNKVPNIWLAYTSAGLKNRHEGGIYDVLESGEKMRVKLKWDADDNVWYEVARIIT